MIGLDITDQAVGDIRTAVRHVGKIDEIAMAYLYCMGQTCATGTVITVDGGAVLV